MRWLACARQATERYLASLFVYALVGGAAAIVEWAVFYVAVRRAGMHYIPAALSGFVLATLVNYYISSRYAFLRRQGSGGRELGQVYAVSVIGLAVNLGTTVALVELARAGEMLAKVAGTGCGFLFNFAGRQFWVFDREPRHRLSTWLGRNR